MINYFWTLLFLGLISCGPMNGTPPESTNTRNTPSMGNNVSQSSKESHFLISISNKTQNSFIIPQTQLGDNDYVIRIAHADLRRLSPEGQVTLTYGMPDMPEMGKETITATSQGDGTTFEATLFFSMSGTWEISLNIKDQLIEDTYVFTELVK
ncbi:MAG: FixH family protein [Deltaproteobacteria bacterium]|nr:FixH family protein [Deltaproteobacteria bacterium]